MEPLLINSNEFPALLNGRRVERNCPCRSPFYFTDEFKFAKYFRCAADKCIFFSTVDQGRLCHCCATLDRFLIHAREVNKLFFLRAAAAAAATQLRIIFIII